MLLTCHTRRLPWLLRSWLGLALVGVALSVSVFPAGALAQGTPTVPASQAGVVPDQSAPVSSPTVRPPRFSTDEEQALYAAEHYGPLDALHVRLHPLTYIANVLYGQGWMLDFYHRGKLAAVVSETTAAHIIAMRTGPAAAAYPGNGSFLPAFGHWWILLPACLLFLLVFFDPRAPLRAHFLDALALLGFLVPYELYSHQVFLASVWLCYPPLVYLLLRMLWVGGFRPVPAAGLWERLASSRLKRFSSRPRTSFALGRGAGRLAPLLSMRTLMIGLIALTAARIGLSIFSHDIIDVGYGSVVGAYRILHGQPIYYPSPSHLDTYGPIAYLAYVPFVWLFPFNGIWNNIAAAHAASIFFDVATIIALVFLGRQIKGGRDGLRLGLVFGWAYAACPMTLMALMGHTNDGLVALLSVLALLAFASPIGSGVLLGLGAAAKFMPGGLVGLYASPLQRGRRSALIFCGVFAGVVACTFLAFTPPGGLSVVWNHTAGFQLTRTDVFSPWALYSSLAPIKDTIEIAVVGLCVALTFWPRQRTLAQVAALSAAATIALQIPSLHFFYFYVELFAPMVLVGSFAQPRLIGAAAPAAARVTAPADPKPTDALPTAAPA
jgi:hypothetical protein